MKIAVICFTQNGYQTAKRIYAYGMAHQKQIQISVKSKYVMPQEESVQVCMLADQSLQEWTAKQWHDADALIFVGATGIAVRAIAPFVCDKLTDPAVLVVDEQSKYCISLLSGHVGGGNALVQSISAEIGAMPIITTATDLNECFALDVYAQSMGWQILDRKQVKQFSAALLAGEALVTMGIGCRKDTSYEQIKTAIAECCQKYKIPERSICAAASIDLKKEEAGIVSYCIEHAIPFLTFSAAELEQVAGQYTESDFVKRVTGVDNVCERSAIAATREGLLIVRKQAMDGVTIAFAIENGGMIGE